jgi:hypothetical protein
MSVPTALRAEHLDDAVLGIGPGTTTVACTSQSDGRTKGVP